MNTAIPMTDDSLLASRPGDDHVVRSEAPPSSYNDPFLRPMWIDRLEHRISSAIDGLQNPGYLLAGGLAACLVLLFAFVAVVSGQVERGQLRNMEEAALRAELWRCSAMTGPAGDRCRQIARGEVPASPLVTWDSPPPVNGQVSGEVLPVSLR
ncbi:MAG: hypothetical protein KA795_11470 [Burkholderiaceae bacterium]|nr:hypothetical protein [Burkholderiaceae bacterium]